VARTIVISYVLQRCYAESGQVLKKLEQSEIENTARRPSVPLPLLLQASTASLLTALLIMGGLSVWSIYSADNFLARANRAYHQLNLVNRIEADISHYLLLQVAQTTDPTFGRTHDVSHESIVRQLDELAQSIQAEINLESGAVERQDIAEEFKTAQALKALFQDVQAKLAQEREIARTLDTLAALRAFYRDVLDDSMKRLREVVGEASFGEEAEAAAVVNHMQDLRRRLIMSSALIGGLTALGALMVSLLVYRAIMRPVSALAQGAERFGQGDLQHRIAVDQPREFVTLANRFNVMAADLDLQQSLLKRSNERLEETVRERTKNLEATTTKLREIDQSRRLFFSKTSHELRTPVTVLMGEAEVALRNKNADSETYREALAHIVASGSFLRRRLEDLISLARSEDGRVTIERQTVDLSQCARQTVAAAEAYARANEVELDGEIVAEELLVDGDPSWIKQAILAVIDNAVKFSPPGSEVTISLTSENGFGVVDIADTGPGVEPEALGSLFDPYFQASGGKRRGGSGLGLTVARWIVEQHNGKISARNVTPTGLGVRLEFELTA
jgi:signal transduction histidine kinase